MKSWMGSFHRVITAPNGVAALAALLEYALQVTEVPAEDLRRFAHQLGPTGDEAYMTGAQQLMVQGRVELLLKQMTTKFGALPQETVRRIRSASSEEIDRYGERVLSATTVEEVLN
jgi:hypothetical protein